MPSKKEIQRSYTKALEQAKTGQCCCSANTQKVEEACCSQSAVNRQDTPSFGCVLLEPILSNHIKNGMVVIDFGSGAGHDLFIAAKLVGSSGKAIGVDFTDSMINEARNAAKDKGLTNVEIVKSDIDNVKLPNEIADVIISNCVINLTKDKSKVFREAFRLLKPGGLLIDADVIAKAPLPQQLMNNSSLWCSCIGGALTMDQHQKHLHDIGFMEVRIELADEHSVKFDSKEHGIYSGIIWGRKPKN